MINKAITDFHVHTSYCDGKNTPREMIETAYSRGFKRIGLTGHSYTPFDESYCMSQADTLKYIDEIEILKKEYEGKMVVLCGIEQDYFAPLPSYNYDYRIGSVHYVKAGDEYLSIDESVELTSAIVADYFDGDFDSFAESYFNLVGNVLNKTDADIIGHFDLISKFSEVLGITESQRYISAGYEAIQKLIPHGKPFEVNVGAITRGYRTAPYPSEAFLREIHRLGGKIIITGDCHSAATLGCNLKEGIEFAKKCGFTSALIMGVHGFEEVTL